MKAEPQVQRKFTFATGLSCALLFAMAVAAFPLFESLPNREPASASVALIDLKPVELAGADFAPMTLRGAWEIESADARVGGVSGLGIDGDSLVAISDVGVILTFPKSIAPQSPVRISELPAGPGNARLKFNRDSEAILRDSRTQGWWVAFENRDEIWLYDSAFDRAVARLAIPGERLGHNSGIEGLAMGQGAILAFPERGGRFLHWTGGGWADARIRPAHRLSDAVDLADGAILLVEREITIRGFSNSLALLRRNGADLRTVWRKRLPLAWNDNVEALAAERTPGGYRLWLMTDDNFHPRMRTLLLAVDLPEALARRQR